MASMWFRRSGPNIAVTVVAFVLGRPSTFGSDILVIHWTWQGCNFSDLVASAPMSATQSLRSRPHPLPVMHSIWHGSGTCVQVAIVFAVADARWCRVDHTADIAVRLRRAVAVCPWLMAMHVVSKSWRNVSQCASVSGLFRFGFGLGWVRC